MIALVAIFSSNFVSNFSLSFVSARCCSTRLLGSVAFLFARFFLSAVRNAILRDSRLNICVTGLGRRG
jgi:hypothetical protein